jgi:hypothetical protein
MPSSEGPGFAPGGPQRAVHPQRHLPTPVEPNQPVDEGRFFRELAEVVAWQEVNTALHGLRRVADLLGIYEDGWGGDTIATIGEEVAIELGKRLAPLSEDELRKQLFERMRHDGD